jgi:hypothetical protein
VYTVCIWSRSIFFFLIVKKETGLKFSVIILVGYSDEMSSSRADRQQVGQHVKCHELHGLHVLPDGVNALPYGTSNEVNSGVFHK